MGSVISTSLAWVCLHVSVSDGSPPGGKDAAASPGSTAAGTQP